MTIYEQIDLERYLKSTGKAFYLKYYKYFLNGAYDIEKIKQIVRENEKYTNKSINTRVSKLKKIISLRLHNEAMENIENSKCNKG